MQSFVKRLLLWSVNRPAAAAALFALVTILFAAQIPRLEVDASNEGFMLEQDPARRYYEQVKATFGSDELTVVMVKADDIFTAPALHAIQRVSNTLERVDGVVRVDSLATVDNISATDDGVEIATLLHDGIPADAEGLARLKKKALDNPVVVGNLVSADAKAAGVLVYTQAAAGDKGFTRALLPARVDEVLAQEPAAGVALYQIGGPLIKRRSPTTCSAINSR